MRPPQSDQRRSCTTVHWKGDLTRDLTYGGPIGTRPVSFVSVRPRQSKSRFGFVQKWTRERHRPPKKPRNATCILQPSTEHPRTGDLSIATFDPEGQPSSATLLQRPTRIASVYSRTEGVTPGFERRRSTKRLRGSNGY